MSKKIIYLVSVALMLGLITSVASADIYDGLVAYWPLNGNADDAVADDHGTLQGNPQLVDGKIGSAVQLDGDGDYILVSPDSRLDITGSITLSAWIKVNAWNTDRYDNILYKQIADLSDRAYRLSRDASSNGVCLTLNSVGGEVKIRGATAINDNEWHLVVGVFDMDATQWFLYVDGQEDTGSVSGSASGNIKDSTGTPLYMGRDPTHGAAGDRDWIGLLDEVAIWNRALTSDEISFLWNDGAGNPLFRPVKGWNPNPKDGTLNEQTWVNLSWSPGAYAVSHDVYFGDSFDAVKDGLVDTFIGNQAATFLVVGLPGFAYPDGLVPGTTYYWRIDEVNETKPNSPWKGDVWSFSIPPRTAYNPNPADGAEFVDLNVALSWTAGFGSKLHTVYFGDNFDDVISATTGGLSLGTTSYTPGPLEREKVYYWRIDEFDILATYKGDVWSFTTPGAVGQPQPANGTTDVEMNAALRWTPADHAASHQVYFGTDKEALRRADTTSPEYKGPEALGSESYDPGLLDWQTAYYWRVDEVNNLNPNSPWKGPLWSFTTADFLIIDDFEDYDIGNNEIWWAWKDGLGYAAHGTEPAYPGNGTGSAVGDESTPSYTEETIVHGGRQSMPLSYDNNKPDAFKHSEAELTLTSTRDWTSQEVTTLSLWFRGDPTNAAERLYVAIANRTGAPAVAYHDDTSATQIGTWTQWVIPLPAFANQGVNLTDVDRIAIGLGTRGNTTIPGGSGKIYFDDIRLYRLGAAPQE